ncbi:NDUFAF5 [Cordylochernes scorpioides]|uniref:Arginine-hydroxylase NDUFAF5, mitochondrial n=1 Tax=Cordylochernes scorpioides TaxID=51811 RepID=A0ABY6KBP4_9ARAC|nr:NDUFAF5 [Cordylochernes scorpioides]
MSSSRWWLSYRNEYSCRRMWHRLRHLRPSLVRCSSTLNIFNREAKKIHRNLAALDPDVKVYDYLREEVGRRLADRVYDIMRKFDTVVDLGCGRGFISPHLCNKAVGTILQCDLSSQYVSQSQKSPSVLTEKLVVDEEHLPYRHNSIDLVISSLSLHWVNELSGALKQIFQILRPDGALIGCMYSGDTLYQLRGALQLAELEREGGIGSHISPFVDQRELGGLLSSLGYTLLTLDVDEITINYPSMFELMWDLKGMAENNATWARKPLLHRDTMLAAASIYRELYGDKESIPATFEILYFIGWKPHPSQPKPLQRGSAQISLKDIGKVNQIIKDMDKNTKT